MFTCRFKALKLVLVLGALLVLLTVSLPACDSLPASPSSLPASPSTLPTAGDGVLVRLTWDEWQDLENCVRFVTEDIGFTLEVATSELEASTVAEANATVKRLTQLETKLDTSAQDSSTGMPVEELQATLDAQSIRIRQFTDLQGRLFDARMAALVSQ